MENVDLKLFSIWGNKIRPYEKHTRITRDSKKSHDNSHKNYFKCRDGESWFEAIFIWGNKIKSYEKHTRITRDCKKLHEDFIRDEAL